MAAKVPARRGSTRRGESPRQRRRAPQRLTKRQAAGHSTDWRPVMRRSSAGGPYRALMPGVGVECAPGGLSVESGIEIGFSRFASAEFFTGFILYFVLRRLGRL